MQEQRGRNARFLEKVTGARTSDTDALRQEVVGSWALKPVSKRVGLGTYLGQLAERRHFIWADSRTRAFSGNRNMILRMSHRLPRIMSRAFSGNRNMILGNLWLILLPVLDGLAYFLIFGVLLQLSRGMENYVAFLLIGIFMFQFTIRSLNNGATAITGSRNVIRAFTFPRASLPIAIVVREAISMVPVIVTMSVLILVLPPRTDVTWHWVLFPAIFLLQGVFNLGIAFFAARATAHIPDLRHLFSVFGRFWRYGSAVMFPFDRFVGNNPQLMAVLELNPLFIIIDMYRSVLLYGEVPTLRSWLLLTAWAVGTLVLGFLYFWRAEEQYGRE